MPNFLGLSLPSRPNAGAGGKSTAKREALQSDGDEAACARASSGDKGPPEGCGALLQIEVASGPNTMERLLVGHVAAPSVPDRGTSDIAALADKKITVGEGEPV